MNFMHRFLCFLFVLLSTFAPVQASESHSRGAVGLLAGQVVAVSGSLIAKGPAENQIVLRVDSSSERFAGESLAVIVREGDFRVYSLGTAVHGELSLGADALELKQVWPNDLNGRGIVQSVNHLLRLDTSSRGKFPFRSMGEFLPPFALYNQRGGVTQSASLKGSYVVFNFIFTRCMLPTMCPLSTQKMRRLRSALSEQADLAVQLVSVTLDPQHDTPGVFNEYAAAYQFSVTDIDFLTGPAQAVEDLKAQLGVLAEPDEKLLVKHSMMVVVADPLGRIIYQIPGSGWSPQDIMKKITAHAASNYGDQI